MKYIMFEDFSGAPIPVIFPNRIDHLEMREQMPYTKVLSAGYISPRAGGIPVPRQLQGAGGARRGQRRGGHQRQVHQCGKLTHARDLRGGGRGL